LREAALAVTCPAVVAAVFPVASVAGVEAPASALFVPPGKVELELMSPMGVIDPPPMLGISPRIRSLEGKTIAMIHNNKPGAREFLTAAEELLKAKYPTLNFTHFGTTINLAEKPEKYAEMAKSCDAFILGSGD
jgi:hypothetical protein